MAVCRSFLFEETSFDELRDGLGNSRRPLSNARVKHPPTKDAIDRVLRIRMPGKVVQDFRRRRWK